MVPRSVSSGHKVAVAINDAVNEAGFHFGTGKGGLNCLIGLENAYRRGVLRPVLYHIKHCYEDITLPNVYVGALAYLEAVGKNKDLESYRALLIKTSPRAVFNAIADAHGGHRPHPRFLPGTGRSSFLAEKYNYRRKVRKIDVIALNEFLA